MFDGARDNFEIGPPDDTEPSRSGGVFVLIGLAAVFWCFVVFICMVASAHAQAPPQPPGGQPVYNQALSARAVTASDTVALASTTRGLFIGDATACNLAVQFVRDSVAVTLTNVQSGALLPFSVIRVMFTGTTCVTVFALY
jgi:hypothetical protein